MRLVKNTGNCALRGTWSSLPSSSEQPVLPCYKWHLTSIKEPATFYGSKGRSFDQIHWQEESGNEGGLRRWESLPVWRELAPQVYEISSSSGSGISIRVSNESQAHPGLIKSLACTDGDLVSILTLSAEEQQTAVKTHYKLFHPRLIYTIYRRWQMLIPFCLFLEAIYISK